jgi:tetraacyldisaccharide-1-P 4'-kinase
LAVTHWEPLRGVKPRKSTDPRGRRLFALCGVADSRPFLQQVRQIGDLREAHALRDHARYRLATARRLARRAETAGVDYVVTTAKDAVKLRHSWPEDAPPVLVAQLAVRWETGEQDVMRSLDRCLAARKATPA